MTEENTNFIDFSEDVFLNSKAVYQETDNELLNYALHYARCGFLVIPLHNLEQRNDKTLCSCRAGLLCEKAGKHPRTRFGLTEGTTNENRIFEWWENHPNSNIGLLTGEESRIFILDVDVRADKFPAYNGEMTLDDVQRYYLECYRKIKKDFIPLPATLIAISGSGGRHLYFKYPSGLIVKSSASGVASDFGLGLDIKAAKSYIVAPPSNHKSGSRYQWLGVNTPIADAPKWLIYEIQKAMEHIKTSNQTPTCSSKSDFNQIWQDGNRNNHFHRYVSGLVVSHSKERVFYFARKYSNESCNPPLTDKEIQATVKWALEEQARGWKKNKKA